MRDGVTCVVSVDDVESCRDWEPTADVKSDQQRASLAVGLTREAFDVASRLAGNVATPDHVPHADALRVVTIDRSRALPRIIDRLAPVHRSPRALISLRVKHRHRLDMRRTSLSGHN